MLGKKHHNISTPVLDIKNNFLTLQNSNLLFYILKTSIMATIIKLTYVQTEKGTLVNLDLVTSMFRIFEKGTRKYATRINFQTEQYVVVEESLQDIMRLAQSMAEGEFQSADWVEEDSGDGQEDFLGRLEGDYQRNTYRPQRQQQYQPRNQYNRW